MPFVRAIAEAVHERRAALHVVVGRRKPPFEDSLFAILLASFALLGDAVLGETTRAGRGLDDPGAARRFRTWFARLLVAHLAGAAMAPQAEAAPKPRRKRVPRA